MVIRLNGKRTATGVNVLSAGMSYKPNARSELEQVQYVLKAAIVFRSSTSRNLLWYPALVLWIH